jgi:hypothetical protein
LSLHLPWLWPIFTHQLQMKDKQKEKIKEKIKKIRRELAAEKRKFGGIDDSRGRRYLPSKLYVQIGDYVGGLRYLKWFNKNFSDDIGSPDFLFESSIILFKTGKLSDAEDYVLKTYFSNEFLIDKFFDRSLTDSEKKARTSFRPVDHLASFQYRHDETAFLEFGEWLRDFILSERFSNTKKEYDDIKRQLEKEPIGQQRNILVERLFRLL